MDYYAVANNANLAAAQNLAVGNIRTADCSHSRNTEGSSDFGVTRNRLAECRFKHTLKSFFYILYCVIDNSVKSYINLVIFSGSRRSRSRADIKSDYNRTRSGRKHNIRLSNRSDRSVNHINANLFV